MTDGNTKTGQRKITIRFTEDEARQVIRSIETERMVKDGLDPEHSAPFIRSDQEIQNAIAERRAFINQILEKMYKELRRQLR